MFSPDTGKYGPEKTSYLDTFCTVSTIMTTTKVTTISSYKEKILLIYGYGEGGITLNRQFIHEILIFLRPLDGLTKLDNFFFIKLLSI